jgi:hypothetical protein
MRNPMTTIPQPPSASEPGCHAHVLMSMLSKSHLRKFASDLRHPRPLFNPKSQLAIPK